MNATYSGSTIFIFSDLFRISRLEFPSVPKRRFQLRWRDAPAFIAPQRNSEIEFELLFSVPGQNDKLGPASANLRLRMINRLLQGRKFRLPDFTLLLQQVLIFMHVKKIAHACCFAAPASFRYQVFP